MHTMTIDKEVHQIPFKPPYYIRYTGVYMACKCYEVIKKPTFEVVYTIEYVTGLWVLYDTAHEMVLNSFVLTNILSFVYKKLK